ncbi:unnamed protein product [Trichogramma brassicae]|uniref:Uncharacterized protein n=1 Tax=Trichogramma brassicae TaxID=86971 RepID=A0A6H5IZ00_9HYME|nr:unnamed protein product [Trichogramma brassicae]
MSANQPELINLAGDGEEIIFVREEIDLVSSSSEDVDEGDVENKEAAGAGNQPRVVRRFTPPSTSSPRSPSPSPSREEANEQVARPGPCRWCRDSPTWYDLAVSPISEEPMETDGESEDDSANANTDEEAASLEGEGAADGEAVADEEAASLKGKRAADGEAVAEEEAAGANDAAEEHRGARYARAFPLAPQEGEEPAGSYDDLPTEEKRDAFERTLMGYPVPIGLLSRCEHVVLRYFRYDDGSWVSPCCAQTTRGHGAQEITLHLVGLYEALDNHLTTCSVCERMVGRSRRPAETCELCSLVVLLNEDDTEEGMDFNAECCNKLASAQQHHLSEPPGGAINGRHSAPFSECVARLEQAGLRIGQCIAHRSNDIERRTAPFRATNSR